jgi:hypothetical protein
MKILGLVGYKESGKDITLACIRELLPTKQIVRLNFADPLKQEVAAALGITVEALDANKKAYRTLLQVWGTDIRRALQGEDYWVLRWGNTLNRLTPLPDLVVATDVRFANEAKLIKDAGGLLLRVTRPEKRGDAHASERELGNICCDSLVNNNSDLVTLKQNIQGSLQHLGII